ISEVKASQCLYDDIAKQGGRPIMWKTGHSLIKAKMKSEQAVLAGEMSGHMFFADRYFGYDDAIYASCRLVEIITKTGKSLSSLVAVLPHTSVTPEIREETRDTVNFELVKQVQHRLAGYVQSRQPIGPNKFVVREVVTIDGVRAIFDDGWGLIRASNTQPALVLRFEATSSDRLAAIRAAVEGELAEVKRTMLSYLPNPSVSRRHSFAMTRSLVYLALAITLLFGDTAPIGLAAAESAPVQAIQTGERLTYEIAWLNILAGTAVMEVMDDGAA